MSPPPPTFSLYQPVLYERSLHKDNNEGIYKIKGGHILGQMAF